MRKGIKTTSTLLLFGSLFFSFTSSVKAVCPVCTVAVASGLGLSRYLGVDDVISGVWIGGLILSSSLWLIDWLNKKGYLKKIKNKKTLMSVKYLIVIVMYLLFLVPLARKDIIGHPFNIIWGIDKLIIGTILGTLAFLLSLWIDAKIRKAKGKQLFNYQKVIIPLMLLAVSSLIVYFFIGYLK